MSKIRKSILSSSSYQWSLFAGIVFATMGLVAALSVTITPTFTVFYGGMGLPKREFPLVVGLASGLVGGSLWWLLVERPGQLTRERGGIVGMVTGVLVHPVTWILVVSLSNLRAGLWPLAGSGSAILLFLIWGIGFFGSFTVVVGVVCGLLVTVVRDRLGADEVTGGSHRRVAATTVLTGWVTVVLIVITGGLFLVMFLGGWLAARVTVYALPRLPVVRTFLIRCYRLDDDTMLTDSPFLWRHITAIVTVGGVGFLIVGAGYSMLTTSLYFSVISSITDVTAGSIWHSLWDNKLKFYPVFYIVFSVPVALVVNRYINSLAPVRSMRRAVFEWTIFFVIVSTSFTVTIVVWYFVVLFP